MEQAQKPKEKQTVRMILLVIMSVVIFGTAVMIINSLMTLYDLRRDINDMNRNMDNFQQELLKIRSR